MKNWIKINLLIVSLVSLMTFQANAQQDVMLTQYSSGLQLSNPAYVGTSARLNIIGIVRNQWLGFEGAPKSQVLLINAPMLRYHLGVGLTLIRDEIGPASQTHSYANVSYNFNLTQRIKLSMGLNGGMSVRKLNYDNLIPVTPNDPTYYESNQTDYLLNFGTGIFLYSRSFYLGFSAPKLLKNSYKTEVAGTTPGSDLRHYYIIGGYLFKLNELWKTKPSFSLKMVKGAPLSIDLTANMIYRDKFWFGANYRVGDALGFIFQYQITEKMRIGYSYDLPMSEMLKNTTGSHEILISYDLLFKDRKNASPRYF